MKNGIVNFYNSDKEYGFVTDLESYKEYYIHVTVLSQIVHKNDLVSFDLQERKDHFIAVNVRPTLNDGTKTHLN